MTALAITPNLLAAIYDMLRTLPTFKRLPHSDGVGFHVVADPSCEAEFGVAGDGLPFIRVSEAHAGTLSTLIATVAHEMIHLRQHLTGDREAHGPRFKRLAARVCRLLGYDQKQF